MKKKINMLDSKLKVIKIELRSTNLNYHSKMSILEKELFDKLKDSNYSHFDEI
jgi:hypothetical protein